MDSIILTFTDYLKKNVIKQLKNKGICDKEGINYIKNAIYYHISTNKLNVKILRSYLVDILIQYINQMKNQPKKVFNIYNIVKRFFKSNL